MTEYDHRPERCSGCHVVCCQKCGSWLKGDNPKFCYGCGTIKPEVAARFCPTDTTGFCYVQDEWMRKNTGRSSDGQYVISRGYASDGSGRMGSWVAKYREIEKDGVKTRTADDIRELTEEEKEYLKDW